MDTAWPAADHTRPQGVQWRLFVRALADEVDSLAGPGERDTMLRGIGQRMARMAPLAPVGQLDALAIEMNAVLEDLGWGHVHLDLHTDERAIIIRHSGLPKVGSLGNPPGAWLAALLEGLYEGWMAQQPGHQSALAVQLMPSTSGDMVLLRFARG